MSLQQHLHADFIIVGGGTSGCLIASRLATELPDKTVLLIEAGSDTRHLPIRSPEHRYTVPFVFPDLDHGYVTTPQESLGYRRLPYLRGKGLGGSSVVNFMAYHYGPGVEYNRWADQIGDEAWRWECVKEKLHELESYNSAESGHGTSGPIHVSVPSTQDWQTSLVIQGMMDFGHQLHLDINSGNPLGVSMNPSSMGPDGRETSATAFLRPPQSNLSIIYGTMARKVDLVGKQAVGVTLADGRTARASNEVILCAGAIDSPRLLLLSGIGDADQLSAVGVQSRHNLPGVGKNLQDHVGVGIMHRMTPQYLEQQGKPSSTRDSMAVTYTKLNELVASEEFSALDTPTQDHMRQAGVPDFEFAGPSFNLAPHLISDDEPYLSILGVAMNPLSLGEIKLTSADPDDPPHINLGLLSHPFDRRVIMEGVKAMMALHRTSAIRPFWQEEILAPSDEAGIWEYVQANAQPALHAAGSVKMGGSADELACVDRQFRVFGLQYLRVADMSVCPVLLSNHPQSTAYLIGSMAVQKILGDYRSL
ncbi:GMC oxidoreductase-domain-containing protein [Aspergillus keveii]|uniref:GMC oxidoreductase-domain-containing protein n=1 Tax=Aspergillus keveii TaxID=714993 RepID=A0ABR4GD44_9EURO